jgi:AcrR family transcriptional regulator
MRENLQDKTPRRQERGKKRMAELLRAAGEVFADVGYENATTNAIAAKAGVSPGTLYQFFSNKQAIAEALANDYAARNHALHEAVFEVETEDRLQRELPLRALIDRLVGPFLEFRRNSPGFDALFVGSVVSRELAERIQVLHQQMMQRIAHTIHVRSPHLRAKAVQTAAETAIQIVKGMLPLALNGTKKQRKIGERELKLVLERYLAPLERVVPEEVKPSSLPRRK